MMDTFFDDKLEQVRREQLGAIPAQRLMEKLQRTYTYIEPYQRRWFWELVQNANDACGDNMKVDIILEVSNDEITFKHNGMPFTMHDAINLIFPNSDKIDSNEKIDNSKIEKPIGKFGSGLISTHILSAQITITGIIHEEEENRSFNIILNRSQIDKTILINELTAEYEALRKSISLDSKYRLGDISASFTYYLNNTLPDVPRFVPSNEYLYYLYNVIPYAMCFMSKIASISIFDARSANIQRFSCTANNRTERDITFSINKNDDCAEKKFKYFSTEKAQTVFEYKEKAVLPYPRTMPRLFCGLPMIGTESTGLPIVLNSLFFTPSDERDSVELTLVQQYNENREILKQAVELYKAVLDYIEANHMSGTYNLAHISQLYKCSNPTSKEQFRKLFIEPSVTYIKAKKIIKNNKDQQYITFGETKIPFVDEGRADEDLYRLVSYIKDTDIPCKEEYKQWVETLDFSIFNGMTYKLRDLLYDVENLGKIHLVGEDHLHEVLSFTSKSNDSVYLLTKLALLPSQDGILRNYTKVYKDDNIPSQLKSIYNLLFTDSIESILLNAKFDDLEIVHSIKSEKDIAISIDNSLKEKYKAQGSVNSSLLSPINNLFDWIKEQYEECGRTKEQLRTLFPWFYEKKESLLVEALPDKNRENVLRIAQSENLDKLSLLANCDPALLTDVLNKVDAIVSAAQQGSSKKEQEEWNQRARELAIISLKRRDYTTPSLSDTHGSIINNVVDKEGVSHTVLVKSAAKGTIYMEPTEWAILFRDPRSIFMVYDGKKIHAQKASVLFSSQDLLQLTFSTENLLFDDRVKRIMSVFGGFENTHLNLRSLNMINRGEEYEEYNFWDNNPEYNSFETAPID